MMLCKGQPNSLLSEFAMRVMVLAFITLTHSACKQQANTLESPASETQSISGGKNGGFRILPQTAARDTLRTKVIYRCNDVSCGDAFQPSNEERDMFFSCSLAQSLGTSGRVPAFMRVVNVGGKQKLIVRKEHQEACEKPLPLEKILAEQTPEDSVKTDPQAASQTTCRAFRGNKEGCQSNEAQGCRWITHPSGRSAAGGQGDCVGLLRASAAAGDGQNIQSLQLNSSEARWAPLESYRGLSSGPSSAPK